jgi:hypothetical protein
VTQEAATVQTVAGWYEQDGGLRFWDGSGWTNNRAPAPTSATTLTPRQIAGAVCVGVLGAWIVILLAAQASPDTFYLPVKFVVKELPSAYGN